MRKRIGASEKWRTITAWRRRTTAWTCAAHEETYANFVALTENLATVVLCIVLLLVLWGLEGHGVLALIGFILTIRGARSAA